MGEWKKADGSAVTEDDLKGKVAFVYLITELSTGKKYVGKKRLTIKKTRPPLKGKKRKRVSRVESDWKTYYGSNETLRGLVEKNGEDNYERIMLHFCSSLGEASYHEAREQFVREVLVRDDYFNDWIYVKVRRSHLRKETR